jgi:hypothetical protein
MVVTIARAALANKILASEHLRDADLRRLEIDILLRRDDIQD